MRQTFFAASALLAAMLAMGQPGPAMAQNSAFSARVMVDGRAITHYEYDQRLRFMRLLNAPGDLPQEAEKTLIEDRLRLAEAKRMKIRLTDTQIADGMTEFASRFELPVEQFLTIIEENGVASATFRDFVHAGLVWREVIRAKYGPGAPLGIYEPEVDRALSTLVVKDATRVLLSEIILPTSRRVQAFELAQSLRGEAAFAAAARAHSLGPTAAAGGRVDWRSVPALPMQTVQGLSGLTPGQVSPPVRLDDGRYALYYLRNIEQSPSVTARLTAVDYTRVVIAGAGTPAGDQQLARARTQADTCNDLNALQASVTRQTVNMTQLPADVAQRLAGLDENEKTWYTQGGQHVLLMLCARRVESEGEPSREAIKGRLIDARVGGQADLLLQRLRSNARITRP